MKNSGSLLPLIILVLLVGGCSSGNEDASARHGHHSKHSFRSGVKERQHRKQRLAQARRECMTQALRRSQTGTVRCGTQQSVVCNENGTFRISDPKGYYKVVCRGNQFVGLAWDSDVHHFFRRTLYRGRWIGRAVAAGHGTRLSRPLPPPAAPNPPSSGGGGSGGLVYSTDNDHGYTGPRCYEPGGYYFHPC